MFVFVREVHAYCGLLLLLFIAMYAVTGFPLMHGETFDLAPEEVVTEVTLDFEGNPDGDELTRYLASEFGVRGRRTSVVHAQDGSRAVAFERPGWSVRFEIAPDVRSARIRTSEGSPFQRTVQLHNLKGFSGGPALFLWGLMLDLASLTMLVFAVTGIYLWYVRSKDRRLGWVLLIASWTLALGATAFFFVSA